MRPGLILFVLLTGCFALTVSAQKTRTRNSGAKGGELTIVAAKVQMLLIAPDGKRTGFEAKSRKVVKEIPNSTYYQDALLQYDSGRADPNTTQTVDVKQAPPGDYRLVVSQGNAADGEEYEIRVNLYLRGGSEARAARIAGTVKAGKVATYELRVAAASANVTIEPSGRTKPSPEPR